MRRLVLGSVVLFIAACGGGVRPESSARPENPGARNSIPTDSATAVFIQALVTQFGEDAVDSCLAAWQDQGADASDAKLPTDKPAEGFREFVVECLGAPAGSGGDARSAGADLRRELGGGDLRASMPSMRSQADR
ncbi:MAG TPA: hypothetical protein VGG91_00890 [Myxococcaceae bacterium]|jgi:hypothetical protein